MIRVVVYLMRATIAAMLVVFLASQVLAHAWYDYACCEDSDCHRIDPEELSFADNKWTWHSARSGAIHVIHIGSRSPIDGDFRIRVSKDGQYHGCERNVAAAGQKPIWVALCFYFPELY
jgi:hypothetical protein